MRSCSGKTYRLRRSAIAFLLPTLLGLGSAEAAVINAGNVTGLTLTTNASGAVTASFALSNGGSADLTAYAPDVIRVNYHWVGAFDTAQPMIAKPLTNWSATAATVTDQGSKYLLQTSQLDVEIEKTPIKIHFKDKSGFYLLQDEFMEYDSAYNYTGQRGTSSSKLKCRKIMPTGQAIFGLGEYGGPLNRRGKEIDCWNTGTYNWGEFTNPTYMNIPFMYGLQPAANGNPAFVYGLFFNNPCRPLFKFGTESGDRYSFQAGDGRMDYFFFGGGSTHAMARVMDRYSELTGRPTFLPKWGLGYHLSRFSYSNQSWVEYIANEAVNSDVPLDAVYLDIDYMDANHDNNIGDGQLRQLTMNSDFPNPAGMISYCAARGVKVIPLIEPWLEPGDTTLYNDANSNLHFIKNNGGGTVQAGIYVGTVSWFDYTSSAMQTWWRGKIINWLNSVNFAGIWNDLTEPEGGDSIPYNGLLWLDGQFGNSTTDSRRQWSNERNYFGLRCAKQSYDTMKEKNANLRPFVLSRSGNAGLQRYGVSWSGDTRANWFYHRATIRFGMGAMISGAAWYGNDVGGFAGTPTDELMVRSTEANALAPFFRNHCDKSAANREPWRFNEPYKSMQRDLIKFRYRLMPYLYTLAYESTQSGEPMNVPLAFDYYDDANTLTESTDYEFLVGDYLLVAPVYNEGASSRSVYLPYKSGVSWYYWHNNQQYGGGQSVNANAPLGTLPMYVRSGAIIPMGPSMQHANEFQSSWLDINCWPDGNSEFTLFEDDGDSWDYLSGDYSKRRMVSSRTEAAWNFTIEAKQGTYNAGARDFYVYCYNPGTAVVQAVKLNGHFLPEVADFNSVTQGWKWADGRIGVKVPDNGSEEALSVIWGNVIDSLQLSSATYSVSETGGTVRIYVDHAGDATGAVSVTYATANGSATSGVHYVSAGSTLNWSAADLASKFFDVTILDNGTYAGDRTFTVNLSNPNGATLGSPASATVTIVENEPLPPDVLITNPPGNITVDATTTVHVVQGVANALNWSGLVWSNSLTGQSGELPIGFSWSIGAIPLNAGTNIITVTATNVGGSGAMDDGADTVYADGWQNADNGGFGFGAWSNFTSSADIGQNGRFMANDAAVNIGTPAWGLYANSGNLSEAKRYLLSDLAVGQTFKVSMDNGFLDPGTGTGVALQNAAGTTLWEFFFNGGDIYYSMSGGTTDVGWTDSGINVEFALTAPTTYRVLITPNGGNTRTNVGSLISAADQDIAVFRAWNFNAGAGSSHDFFFNNLELSSPPGASGPSTSAVVQIVRLSDGSLIPASWRDRYGLSGPNSGDYEDRDFDGSLNIEEYWADTNPTNPASHFGVVNMGSTTSGVPGVITLYAVAPTTNSRSYDVYYASDLITGPWLPMNVAKPGMNDGSSLMFTVTNVTDGMLFYQSRVYIPNP